MCGKTRWMSFSRYFLLFFFLPIFFLSSCSKDSIEDDSADDGENPELVEFVLTIPKDERNILENTSIIYLSNHSGEILDSAEIDYSQENIITFMVEESNGYDITIRQIDELVPPFPDMYTWITYTNIVPGAHTIGEFFEYPDPVDVSVIVNNAADSLGNIPFSFFYSNSNGIINIGSDSVEISWTVALNDGFYSAFKKVGEPYPRFFWHENVTEPLETTVDFQALPFADDLITFEVPSNDYFSVRILGSKTNSYFSSDLIQTYSASDGSTYFEAYTKTSLFDYFTTTISYSRGDKNYAISKKSEIASMTVDEIIMDFEIINPTPSSFDVSTSGNYDGYTLLYKNELEGADINVSHNILGNADDLNTLDYLDTLQNELMEEFSISSSDLNFKAFKMIDLDLNSSSENYVQFYLDGSGIGVGEAVRVVSEFY